MNKIDDKQNIVNSQDISNYSEHHRTIRYWYSMYATGWIFFIINTESELFKSINDTTKLFCISFFLLVIIIQGINAFYSSLDYYVHLVKKQNKAKNITKKTFWIRVFNKLPVNLDIWIDLVSITLNIFTTFYFFSEI